MDICSVLVFNTGSSSLKFALFDELPDGSYKVIVRGAVNDIGGKPLFSWTDGITSAHILTKAINHESAVEFVLDWLQNLWPFGSLLDGVRVVAHRIIHGGKHFSAPVIVTEKVMAKFEKLTFLASLHNTQAISVIRACQKKFPNKVLTIAVFDTDFPRDLPQNTGYALPEPVSEENLIAEVASMAARDYKSGVINFPF